MAGKGNTSANQTRIIDWYMIVHVWNGSNCLEKPKATDRTESIQFDDCTAAHTCMYRTRHV